MIGFRLRGRDACAAAFCALLLLQGARPLPAASRPVSPPTSASTDLLGFSAERLRRLDATIQQYVDQGRVAGVVVLVRRAGRTVHFESFGKLDRERGTDMRRDAIFRIASMSKAVTTVAALMLVEEGKLTLSDRVSRYIPAFAKTSVAVAPPEGSKEPYKVVPAKREITIHDLMTHTSGISYGDGPAKERYEAAGVYSWYFADKNETLGEVVDRLATLPFDAQPGEKWVYGFSVDVLGRVVEVASGMSLDEFLEKRIFRPLRMPDTSFFLPPAKRSRLAAVYSAGENGALERAPDRGKGQGDYVDGPRRCLSPGAGLLSTASDYARFLQMLANGGELDGARLLSPKSVELATTNHVGSLYREGRDGFGLGFEVVEDVGRDGRPGSVGRFGWGGAYYTEYWVDPREKLVAIFLSQLLPAGDVDLEEKFRNLVYQAIVAPSPAMRPRSSPDR